MTPDEPKLVEYPPTPEIFSSNATGFFVVGQNIAITFESLRVSHTGEIGPVERVVVARLVLPVGAAQGLALGLHDFLTRQGFDPLAAAKGGATAQ